jgi:hypothetical protein
MRRSKSPTVEKTKKRVVEFQKAPGDQKPKMTSADSQSLWNFTASPGWSQEEVKVLKAALMKFGIGRWKLIKDANCLPNKTIS